MDDNRLKLNDVWQRRYRIARFLAYFLFIVGIFYGMYLVLFPSAKFVFSFRNPDASKNTIVEPRNEAGNLIKNGKLPKNGKMLFDANPLGDFSEVEISFTLEKESEEIETGNISVRRSYRSFFYPEGEALGDVSTIDFPRLLSANESVFIQSQEKIWPIADVPTFEAMGWIWSDVAAASSEEIGAYEKQKLFTLKTPHPDGTVFSGKESGKYYLIENGTKKEIENPEEIIPKLKINPVIADERGIKISEQCVVTSSLRLLRKYKCKIPIESMQDIIGNDYQFEVSAGSAEMRDLDATFRKTPNVKNLKSSTAILKSRIFANY